MIHNSCFINLPGLVASCWMSEYFSHLPIARHFARKQIYKTLKGIHVWTECDIFYEDACIGPKGVQRNMPKPSYLMRRGSEKALKWVRISQVRWNEEDSSGSRNRMDTRWRQERAEQAHERQSHSKVWQLYRVHGEEDQEMKLERVAGLWRLFRSMLRRELRAH